MAGCNGFKKPNSQNFTAALNYSFSHSDRCLFPSPIRFPYEISTAKTDSTSDNRKGLDVLKAAGLLKSLEDRDIHVIRYEQTTYGNRVPPRFCYGHREVTSIDGWTPPVTANGEHTTEV